MIPAQFEYEAAGSVSEAVELLGSHEDAKLLAGGHSLIPAMKLRIARPATLVDIGGLPDLSYVREDGDAIAIGALTRHHDVAASELLRERCGIVAGAAAEIGDPQVRHRGTIGGSVAHGDPASDMPGVLLALDAEFVATGPGGERRIPAQEFDFPRGTAAVHVLANRLNDQMLVRYYTEELDKITSGRRYGPQPLAEILPIVLARLGVVPLESKPSGEKDLR